MISRFAILLALGLLLQLPATSFAQVENIAKSRTAYNEGVTAYRAQDYAAALLHFEQALSLRPYHPGLIYTVAALHALNNQTEEALDLLKKVADMSVQYPAASDTDFDTLKSNPRFEQILHRFEKLDEPVGHPEIAATLAEKDLITEAVAFAPNSQTFFISSVHKRKILRIAKDGSVSDFVSPGATGLFGVFALHFDGSRNLWASTSAIEQMTNFSEEDDGKAAIFKFAAQSGKVEQKFALADSVPHIFGDFALHKGGDVFISDSKQNAIYRLSPKTGKYALFVPPGQFGSLQGLAFTEDNAHLFAADYSQGLFRADVASGEVKAVAFPDTICLLGVDGLYFYDGSLLATQNGIQPHRVVRLFLSPSLDAITRAQILVMNHPAIDDPTLGCVVGDDFYFVANSQWSGFQDGEMKPVDELQTPTILKVELKD